jgi:hypothetical protein
MRNFRLLPVSSMGTQDVPQRMSRLKIRRKEKPMRLNRADKKGLTNIPNDSVPRTISFFKSYINTDWENRLFPSIKKQKTGQFFSSAHPQISYTT